MRMTILAVAASLVFLPAAAPAVACGVGASAQATTTDLVAAKKKVKKKSAKKAKKKKEKVEYMRAVPSK